MKNLTDINSLSGPDAVANDQVVNLANANKYVGAVSGTDTIQQVSKQAGLGATKGAVGTVNTDGGGIVINAGFSESPCNFYTDPDYEFSIDASGKTFVSEDVLHRYLDRAICMQGMSAPYDQQYCLGLNEENEENRAMLLNIHPKYVGRMGYLWGLEYDLGTMLDQMAQDAAYLHCFDSQIICEAAILENVSLNVNGIPIEAYVLDAFSYELALLGYAPATYPYPNFSYPDIIYSVINDTSPGSPSLSWLQSQSYPDISNIQTQMWFYFLAKNYIDCGFEAIHMGQVGRMNYNDPGNQIYWSLLQKIRAYARDHARRGVVLLNTGVYYYDPPDPPSPIPAFMRQLLFDFHTYGILYTANTSLACTDYDQPDPYQPVMLPGHTGVINLSTGGLNPQGWLCVWNPYYSEFDNGGGCNTCSGSGPYQIGCNFPIGAYSWDDISYFATQDIYHRNLLLIYLNYKAKCLDVYGHIEMPGRRGIFIPDTFPFNTLGHIPQPSNQWYRANASSAYDFPCYQNENTIIDIWNGVYASPSDWVHFNFTINNVGDANSGMQAASSLIFVGTGAIYYIGYDGYIYGYIKVKDNSFGGVWLTVSPSYAAQIPASSQVTALSSLVASPDGTWLLYIGTDGYIHGFNIITVWTYEYFEFMKDDMISQSIKATGSLIFPEPDRIYYIADYYVDGVPSPSNSNRVQGFQNSSTDYSPAGPWQTVSPTYSAEGVYGQSLSTQIQAAGALTYDSGTNRIYYRGVDGLLYYYTANTLIDYYYAACPGNHYLAVLQIAGNLAVSDVAGQSRIYFVGSGTGGDLSVYMLLDAGGSWGFLSLANNAYSVYGQPLSGIDAQSPPIFGQIAVSPDGNTIAYFGSAQTICYYSFDGVNYYFNNMQYTNWGDTVGDNSLQFIDNDDLYYIASSDYSTTNDFVVHHYAFQEAYCENPSIAEIECTVTFPSVAIIQYGSQWFIRLTFTSCAACNEWTFSYWNISHPDSGTQSVTIDCSDLPYTIDVSIHPDFVLHGALDCTYGYTLTSCCGMINNSSVSWTL